MKTLVSLWGLEKRSVAAQKGLHLEQAVVGTAQDRLRLLDRIDLSSAGLLPNLEVLQQEVARPVQGRNVLTQSHQVRRRRFLVLLRRIEVALETGLLALLLGDRLAVRRTLLRALLHQLLVVLLRVRLVLRIRLDLHLKLVRELRDQRRRAACVLLRVSARGRRRRRRGNVRRRTDRRKDGDTRACNARLRGCGLLRITRVSATRLHVDALFLRQLTALRRLVRRRVVELVQAVLGDAQQLNGRVVLRRHRHELLVLGLARLRSLRDRLVERNDAVLQSLDLILQRRDAALHILDGRSHTLQLVLQVDLLVPGRFELRLAPVLLGVVVLLFLAEQNDHVVDHLDHLLEAHLLALESKLDEAQLLRVALRSVLHRRKGLVANASLRAHLQKRRRRKRLLEQVQRIVIVQDLDRLLDSDELLRATLHTRVVVRSRRRATLLQLRKELLIFAQRLLRVLEVVLQVDDLHRHLAVLIQLHLDRLSRGRDLLLLRSDQRFEIGDGTILRLRDVGQLLLHVLQELLQDANDLARSRRVTSRSRQELRQRAAGVAVQGLAVQDQVAKRARRVALQERARHALHDRVNSLRACRDVRLVLRRLRRELRGLLLALRRRIRDRLLRRLAVLLVLREVRLQLCLRRHRLLDGRLDLRNLVRQLRDASPEGFRVRLAVAHVLLVHLLVLFAVGINLLGHRLEKCHDAPNRVRRRLLLSSDCSCLYSCETEQNKKGAHSGCVRAELTP